jgi:hypothetical protein
MDDHEKSEKLPGGQLATDEVPSGDISEVVNASGHKQELDRSFGLWSICSISVCTDNAWAAGGGSLVCNFVTPFLTRTQMLISHCDS